MAASRDESPTWQPVSTGRRRSVLRSGAGVCAFLVMAIVLVACGGDGDPKVAAAGVQGASEITAEPVSSAGDNPFTAPAGKDRKGVKPPRGAASPGGGPASYRGGLPGLYGGTRDYATCDADKLIAFLEQNPDKAAAWAGVLGIQVTEIRRYVGRLTPVLLRTDTRVTNHGFVNGRATPIQSVLQAGTAVFVTRYGEPVIKCYCGNPLRPPIRYVTPTYVGPRWPGFSTTNITIINRNTTIIKTFTLYDPETGKTFGRLAGTSGEIDDTPIQIPLPPMMEPAPTPPPVEPQPSQPPPETTPAPATPEREMPRASFTPNPGRQGDNFTIAVFGFRPGAQVQVTLTRPDGVVEHYSIDIEGDSGGSYTFTATENAVTGTYNATVTNPSTGAQAHASVQVLPGAGP